MKATRGKSEVTEGGKTGLRRNFKPDGRGEGEGKLTVETGKRERDG